MDDKSCTTHDSRTKGRSGSEVVRCPDAEVWIEGFRVDDPKYMGDAGPCWYSGSWN